MFRDARDGANFSADFRRRESISAFRWHYLLFFLFSTSDENARVLASAEWNEEESFRKEEARRYVAFLSSTGTLPVPLPLPRDCPVNTRRLEDKRARGRVCHPHRP